MTRAAAGTGVGGGRLGQSRRRRRRRGAIITAAGLAVALGAGGGAAYWLARPSGPEYRTAVAAPGSVVQQASGTGTVGLVAQDQAAFQVAGTVADLAVAVGETVTAGQTLATLDPSDLDESVQEAEEALADAEEQLAQDLEDQASGSSSSSSSSSAAGSGAATIAYADAGAVVASNAVHTTAGATTRGGPAVAAGDVTGAATVSAASDNSAGGAAGGGSDTPAGGSGGAAGAVAEAVAAVEAAQDELLAAYDAVQGLLEAAADGLGASEAACADFLAAVFPVGVEPDTGEGADGEGGAAELAAIQLSLARCQGAIAAAQSGQTEVGAAQAALLDKVTALNAAVEALAAAADTGTGGDDPEPSPEPSPEPTQPGGGQGSAPGGDQSSIPGGDQGSMPGGTGLGNQGSSPSAGGSVQATITAEQILSDRAQIALKEAEAAITRSERQAATLTATVSGTVVAVNAAAGGAVTAGQTVVVVDAGAGFTVTMTLGLSTIKELAVGNPAVFTAGSTAAELTGQVTGIGVTNLSNTSVPSFAVVLSVDQADAELFSGASVGVVITVASSDDVVTVPTSAVHVSGNDATVQRLEGSELTDVPVTVGAMGAELTEIIEGVALGDLVVLADLSKDVIEETSSTASNGVSSLVGGGMTVGGGLNSNVVPAVPGGAGPMMRGN
ncbi:MAG: HlyD family efflux transporter periplasmic adaptor subunit [Bifidobacteriaceae bacterium]|jgi:multidrug efflux pump subunit AcrA (membrane-fusion protein)|nr:HlyD family efflux transporter periplasmic adaptor subunit [Bifidobacteriaceae bacterium]